MKHYPFHDHSDMQNKTYRNPWIILMILFIGMVSTFSACEKEHNPGIPPLITLNTGPGYIYNDTSLAVGDRVEIGINGLASGGNITFFQVSVNNGSRKILLDSGLNNPDISYDLSIIKSASEYERWTFLVMDRDRNKDSIHIVLEKSDVSNYGNIITYTDLVLGAQEYAQSGSFLSFIDGQIFGLEPAFQNQVLIDLIYYYGEYEGTLSSPNEADAPTYFTGPTGVANWTIKNETRYDTTMLTPQAFDLAQNDSLLLMAYEPTEGKRKTKFIVPGMVVSFKSKDGKIGLIKLQELISGPEGYLKASVKIQE